MRFTWWFILSFIWSSNFALGSTKPTQLSARDASEKSESHQRDVDKAALASQDRAISQLLALMKRYTRSSQENMLLTRLGDLYFERTSILFRISQFKKNSTNDQKNYQRSLQLTIQTLSTLISRFPSNPDLDRAYYMRGKSQEDLGNKAAARKDYLHLVKNYRQSPWNPSAYMALAEFAIESNAHAEAISYFKEVEKNPDSPHFPYALSKMAWSFYNLKDIPNALTSLEKHIHFYDELRTARKKGLTSSDESIQEHSYLDAALFYLEGFEQNPDRFGNSQALKYFQSISTDLSSLHDKHYGKMLHHYSKLLRAHGHEKALAHWADLLIEKESKRPETLLVLLVAFEGHLNRNQFRDMETMAPVVSRLVQQNRDRFAVLDATDKDGRTPLLQSIGLFVQSTEHLQKLVIKNKKASELKSLQATLIATAGALMEILPANDPRISIAHFNLAETLFEVNSYPEATLHYRWIVENAPHLTQITSEQAQLRAISSRYQELKIKQWIPGKLTAQAFPNQDPDLDAKVRGQISEWVAWIDALRPPAKDATFLSQYLNFRLEANRTLYHHGKIREATERSILDARKEPSSATFEANAGLALDTLLLSQNWQRSYDQAEEFAKISRVTPEFTQKLKLISADAFLKLTEIAFHEKHWETVIDRAEEFQKKYPKNPHMAEILFLSAQGALQWLNEMQAKDPEKTFDNKQVAIAEKQLSELITEFPKAAQSRSAYLARGAIRENRLEFRASALDYAAALSLPAEASEKVKSKSSEFAEIRRKILLYLWIENDSKELSAVLNKKEFCIEAVQNQCALFSALSELDQESFPGVKLMVQRVIKAQKPIQVYLALKALSHGEEVVFRDQLMLIRVVASQWETIDPMIAMTLMPLAAQRISNTLTKAASNLKIVAPLIPNEKYIAYRIELMKDFENTVAKLFQFPLSSLKVAAMGQLSKMYLEFSEQLGDLHAPKSLTGSEADQYLATLKQIQEPFQKKGNDLENQKQMLQRNSGLGRFSIIRPFAWTGLIGKQSETSKSLSQSLRRRALSLQRDQAELNRSNSKEAFALRKTLLMKRVQLLLELGAESEALSLMKDEVKKLAPEQQGSILLWQLSHWAASGSEEQSRETFEAIMKLTQGLKDLSPLQVAGVDDEDRAFVLIWSAHWLGFSVEQELEQKLLREARGSGLSEYRDWVRDLHQKNAPKSQADLNKSPLVSSVTH